MSKIFKGTLLLLVGMLLLSGCVSNKITVTIDPTFDITHLKSMHVIKHDADKRGINIVIADKLKNMGYSVTTGVSPASDVEFIVTYKDKWMWDITTFMFELTITIRDSKTDFPLASGNSLRTSLTRESPEKMVDEVLTNIFKQGGKL